jgi:hypothetical protein
MTSSSISADLPASRGTTEAVRPGRLSGWLREPLVHFVLLGALLFGIDHLLLGGGTSSRTIVVGAAVDEEAISLFKASRGQDPTKEELQALRLAWLDNEVLYREGLALQLDKGDSTIRDRVIFKSLSIIESNLKRPPLDDKVLAGWFEKNRARYDQPVRYDFLEAVLAEDNSEASVRAFAKALNAGTPGDAKAGLRVFTGRPHSNITQSYGETFAQALEASPIGVWQALQTKDGWRTVQLKSIAPAQAADLAQIKNVVAQDWIDAVMSELRTAEVRTLAKKYDIRFEGDRK